jgi:hypothetical protein
VPRKIVDSRQQEGRELLSKVALSMLCAGKFLGFDIGIHLFYLGVACATLQDKNNVVEISSYIEDG